MCVCNVKKNVFYLTQMNVGMYGTFYFFLNSPCVHVCFGRVISESTEPHRD